MAQVARLAPATRAGVGLPVRRGAHRGRRRLDDAPDQNGHTSDDTGYSCPSGWQGIHPFLAAYQTDNGDGTCTPSGTSGTWSAATGTGAGWEHWTVDLAAYAGSDVEVSISYASDETVQAAGVFVDDIEVSTGEGSTAFEPGADPLNGGASPGRRQGPPATTTTGRSGRPPSPRPRSAPMRAGRSRASRRCSPSWQRSSGPTPGRPAAASSTASRAWASPSRRRPGRSTPRPSSTSRGPATTGSSTRTPTSGTATAWPWSAGGTPGSTRASRPTPSGSGASTRDRARPRRSSTPGMASPTTTRSGASRSAIRAQAWSSTSRVYARGAMTLQALRQEVGDDDFFTILRRWARTRAGGNVTTDEFISLAERVSGKDLGDLFDAWLYTPSKPAVVAAQARRSAGGLGRRPAPRAAGGAEPAPALRPGRAGSPGALMGRGRAAPGSATRAATSGRTPLAGAGEGHDPRAGRSMRPGPGRRRAGARRRYA